MKMTFRFSFLGGALAVGALLALPGCGDDTEGGGGSGTTSTTTGSTTGSTTGTTTTTTTATGTGAGCDAYCTDILANCQDANAQYPDMAACLGSCAGMPDGAPGATDGNSIACRTYHAGAAEMDPLLHCGHAGPSGADTCGVSCEGYCTIVQHACTGANAVYATEMECMTACEVVTDDVPYTSAANAGDSLSCRIYHATVAASSPDMAPLHCPHVAAVAADPQNFPCQ